MVANYKPMWTELGLNLEAHDAPLGILGNLYQDTCLSQKDSLFYIHIHKEKMVQSASPKRSKDVVFITTDRLGTGDQ